MSVPVVELPIFLVCADCGDELDATVKVAKVIEIQVSVCDTCLASFRHED